MMFQEMLKRAASGEILAAADEGAAWEDFEIISSAKGKTGRALIADARELGFRIFVVPDEGMIFDDIAQTVQAIGEYGRGELVRSYDAGDQ